jgi:transaldolase
MELLRDLAIQLFADGADKNRMLALYSQPFIKGFTTNPTLMRKAGVSDYRAFAKDVLSEVRDKPVCFEVFADNYTDMQRQALDIASWGDNVYVKIPVTNTLGQSCKDIVRELARRQVKLNVTAIMTLPQVQTIAGALDPATPSYVSVFAGRIADTGIDPVPIMRKAAQLLRSNSKAELVWASSREIINIFQAEAAGCAVITITDDVLTKLSLIGYDLGSYSLDTVKMFHDDAKATGYLF